MGIGRGIARRFAEAVASVLITELDEAPVERRRRAEGGRLLATGAAHRGR